MILPYFKWYRKWRGGIWYLVFYADCTVWEHNTLPKDKQGLVMKTENYLSFCNR